MSTPHPVPEPAAPPVAPPPSPAPSPSAAPPAPPAAWSPARKSRVTTVVIVVVAVVAIGLLLRAFALPPFGQDSVRTQNAYVRGRTAVIAPQVSGYVTRVAIRDYETVRRGQVLVQIDDRIYRQRVAQAQASLALQEANLANSEQSRRARLAEVLGQRASIDSASAQRARAQVDLKRIDELASQRLVSIREQDQARTLFAQTDAQLRQSRAGTDVALQQVRSVAVGRAGLLATVEAARASLRLAQIDLENTTIRAPEDGRVGEVGVRLGQYVTNGTQMLAVVPKDTWVIANFKEAQTAHVRAGQPVRLVVDGLDDAVLTGTVERLSPAAGSEFAVLKADNATGNYVRVPQRIGVRIAFNPDQAGLDRLRPGMSVEATVDTHSFERTRAQRLGTQR